MHADATRAALETALAGLRARLVARHAWTHLEVTLELDAALERVAITGEVVGERMTPAVRTALEPICAARGLALILDLRPLTPNHWHALAEPRTLWSRHPSFGPRERATEVAPGAMLGWLGSLGEHDGSTLVRGRDGTIAWIDGLADSLGPAAQPPRLPQPPTFDADTRATLVATARRFLDVRYRLGGTTQRDIDCSGLVQRIFAEVGAIVPRNSNDQLAAAGSRPPPIAPKPGDLWFIHSKAEARTHVGVVTERETIVQASLSQRRVVEQPLSRYLADAARDRLVDAADIHAWASTQAGRRGATLPEPLPTPLGSTRQPLNVP